LPEKKLNGFLFKYQPFTFHVLEAHHVAIALSSNNELSVPTRMLIWLIDIALRKLQW